MAKPGPELEPDPGHGERRQRGKVRHKVVTMVRQRVHAVALGYEDLKDQGQSDGNSAVAAMEGGTVARSCIDEAVWTTA